MNWGQFKDLLYYLCLGAYVVPLWPATQAVTSSNKRSCRKLMLSHVSVCFVFFWGGGVSLVPCPFWEWVSLVSASFWGWVCPGSGRYVQGVGNHLSLDMGPGIPRDMVGKKAVCILLECYLVCHWIQREHLRKTQLIRTQAKKRLVAGPSNIKTNTHPIAAGLFDATLSS